MATQNILCTGIGENNDWGLGGPYSKWQAMNPGNDSFSDGYIAVSSIGTYYQSFTITPPAPRLSITSWTTWIVGGKNANQAGSNFGMTDAILGWLAGPTSCAFNVFIWSAQGFSQGWSPTSAQIDAPTIRHYVYNTDADGTHPSYVDQFYSVFVYEPTGGCFLPIWSLVAPFIGVGLQLKDMARLASFSIRKVHFKFDEHEYKEALRQWREYRHPKHFLLRAA